jgi:beta-lactamase class A
MLDYMRHQKYRWGLWRGVPPGIQIANKTGNLDGVLNDVGVIYSPAGNYILSVFTYGMKKKEARVLINNISAAVFESYTGIKSGLSSAQVKQAKEPRMKLGYRRAKDQSHNRH